MGVKVGAAGAVAEALGDLGSVEIRQVDKDKEGQATIVAEAAGHRYELRAVWVGHGWPSEVRRALDEFQGVPPGGLVFTARRFSPGAIQTLRDHGTNWADQAGQARIVMPPGLVVLREAAPDGDAEPPQAVRWSPSATQIAELVLHERLTEFHTGNLAERTGWSAGQVSKVLKMFDQLGWTEQRGGRSGRATRRVLVAPGPLLDSWADHVGQERRRKRRGHRVSQDLLRFAHMELWQRLGRDRSDWALTTWAGLELIAPFATAVSALHIYVSAERFAADVENVMRSAGIREVEEGARIEFWEASFPILVQSGEPSQMPVISRPRLYADLLALGGRAVDAAQHYRETVLGI